MSNRLTFSLASLIFLIAFGLIFAPTSVLADEDDTEPNHKHPTVEITVADADTSMAGDQMYNDADGNPQIVLGTKFQLKFTFDTDVTGFGGTGQDDDIVLRGLSAAFAATGGTFFVSADTETSTDINGADIEAEVKDDVTSETVYTLEFLLKHDTVSDTSDAAYLEVSVAAGGRCRNWQFPSNSECIWSTSQSCK